MATKVLSRNGYITYSDGHPLVECVVCQDEHTDIRELFDGQPVKWESPICIYCANSRNDAYKPVSYLGAS